MSLRHPMSLPPSSPLPPQPLQRRSSVELAAAALRERIVRGDYAEGAPLRQDALAAELGVSRIPVREALRQLEAEGLVTIHVHHGAVVSVLSLPEIEELFELRSLIESDLIRRAVSRLTDEDVERAERALESYDESLADGSVGDWGGHNWRFHAALLGAAGRPLSLDLAAMLHNRSDRYMRMQLSLTGGEHRARVEHHEILDAAVQREARRAAALLREHIRSAGAALVTFLREHRDANAGERAR
jgi:DNA-binding GntR family transcriptional regulator